MTRRAVATLGVLFFFGGCGGTEFVSDDGDAGPNGGSGGTSAGSGGTSAGNAGSATGGSSGNTNGGSAAGGMAGSSGGSGGSGGSFDCASMDCDDGNECTSDSCDSSEGCLHDPREGQACNDGVFCNGEDRCVGTKCEEHLGPPCNGAATTCDEVNDTCVGCVLNTDCPGAIVGAWSNCSFESTCVLAGTKTRSVTTYACETGTCKPSVAMEPGTCSRVTDNQACNRDGNACTNDVCMNGTCTHPALPDGAQCTDESATGTSRLCCGGHCKSTNSDTSHCGGCFVACSGTPSSCTNGYCGTCGSAENDCDALGKGWTCDTSDGNGGRCECGSVESCPMPWQTCSSEGQCRGVAPADPNGN